MRRMNKVKSSPNAKKPAKRPSTRGASNRSWLRVAGVSGICLALLVSVLASLWLLRVGPAGRLVEQAMAASFRLSADFGFAINSVLVEGRQRTPRGAILEALGVHRGAPILAFDPFASRENLQSLPWIAEASVERRLPSVVYVRIKERRPIALWQSHGQLAVIDDQGAVILGAKIDRFAALPLVVGPGAPEHAADLLHMLASEPSLKHRVSAAIRVGERRWNLRLDDAIDIRLPEIEAKGAWEKLARIEREHGILSGNVTLIDLRLPDRLVVRPKPDSLLGKHGGKEQAT